MNLHSLLHGCGLDEISGSKCVCVYLVQVAWGVTVQVAHGYSLGVAGLGLVCLYVCLYVHVHGFVPFSSACWSMLCQCCCCCFQFLSEWRAGYASEVWCENVRSKEKKKLWKKKGSLNQFPYPWRDVKPSQPSKPSPLGQTV